MKSKPFLLFTVFIIFCTNLNATIRYVKSTTSGTGDGSSWANASNDIQAMITASSINDTIWIAEGTYYPDLAMPNDPFGTFNINVKGLKIFGSFAGIETTLTQRNINAHQTVLSGDIGIVNDSTDNTYTVVTIAEDSALLNGLFITKGNEQYYGALSAGGVTINAAYSNTNVVNIDSCYIYSNSGMYTGGLAVYGKAYITNTIINNNTTSNFSGYGGGIYVENGYLSLNKCTVKNNFAGVDGGGIYSVDGIISNSIIENNKSKNSNGGGIYLKYGNLTLINDTVRNNTADYFYSNGGGLYNENGTANITNCVFNNNTAGANGNGGGISGSYGANNVTVVNSEIYNNSAYIGGGLHFERPFTLTDSKVYNNTATNYGGGLSAYNSATYTLLRDTFYNNIATNEGGALYNRSIYALANKCWFYNNNAKRGGAVYNNENGFSITQSIFNNNTATLNGGGAIYSDYQSPNIANSLFYKNQALGSNGGAIFTNAYNSTNIQNNTFFGNEASGSGIGYIGGGAIALSDYTNTNILNNIFSKNKSNNNKDSIGSDIAIGNSITSELNNNLLQLDSLSYENGSTFIQLDNIYRKQASFIDTVDIDGADNNYFTADDVLILQSCSPALNTGKGAYGYQSVAQNNSLATVNTAITDYQAFITYYGNCGSEVANVLSTGASPIIGNTTVKVWIETIQPVQFVKRHYEITPATAASTATGRITLYFTQTEFDDFNIDNDVDLPTGSSDATGIANLQIEKRGGESSDGSGLPGTYTGSIATIDPADADIVWNAAANRWEISFDVTGFSGFFVKTITAPLPLNLLSFSGIIQSNNDVLLQWQSTNEINTNRFEIEVSSNGNSFVKLGTVTAKNTSSINNYQFTDNSSQAVDTRYYRLKMIDNDGRFKYSTIVKMNITQQESISIYPNPVTDVFVLNVNNKLLNTKAKIIDMSGSTMMLFTVNRLYQNIDIRHLAKGMYLIRFADGSAVKLVKE
jgi:hypothetical protein